MLLYAIKKFRVTVTEFIGLTVEGILQAEKLGAQRQWLRNSELIGPQSLIHPQQLYKACLSSGLSAVYVDYFDFDSPTVVSHFSLLSSLPVPPLQAEQVLCGFSVFIRNICLRSRESEKKVLFYKLVYLYVSTVTQNEISQ